MKNRFLTALLSLMTVGSVARATDLEVSEPVRGKLAATEAAAGANFKTRCEEWEKTIRDDAGKYVLYLSCGADQSTSFSTRHREQECYTRVTENGQTYTECDYIWYNYPAYAYANTANGKILFSFDGAPGTLTDDLGGAKFTCPTATNYRACFEARDRAFTAYEERCAAFRAKAKASFGDRYLYASCGDPNNTASGEAQLQFQYVSKGTIYYRR